MSVVDREALKGVVARMDLWRRDAEPFGSELLMPDEWNDVYESLTDAARSVLEGEAIWWCEEHRSNAASDVIQTVAGPIGMCHWYSLTKSEGQERCSMVRVVVVPIEGEMK